MENGHSNGKEIKLGQLTQDPDVNINVLRRSTRIPYHMRLKYSLLNSKSSEDSEMHLFSGSTFNISEHGIGMEGTKGFPPNFKIHATLFTGAKVINFEGTIKWLYHSNSEKWYMGVEISSRRDELKEIYATLSQLSNPGM
jgi:hypothetical protein